MASLSAIDKWLQSNYIQNILSNIMKRWNISYDQAERQYFMVDLSKSYHIVKLELVDILFTHEQYEKIQKCFDESMEYAIKKGWYDKRAGDSYDDILELV